MRQAYAGIFKIAKANGTKISVNAYTPFLIVDGVGYRTKYDPCEELHVTYLNGDAYYGFKVE